MEHCETSPWDVDRRVGLVRLACEKSRMRVMLALKHGPVRFVDIRDIVCQSQPAASHHLALLKAGGFIRTEKRGRNSFFHLTESGARLVDFVENLKT